MKTLKKTLCLVLVLVMSLSLVTVASAAEYTDVAEDNDYATAIEVMSAIDVLDGMGNGKFDPEGTLTRAQAAKIVTYMLLTKDVADDLPNNTKPFEDVKEGYWAAGSIAYLKETGAISGRTAKEFDPEGKVTGYEFGKMVLEAAGIEGNYTGSAWTINVARVLNSTDGMMDNMDDVKMSEPLTRAAAAQLAFNALDYGKPVSAVSTKYHVVSMSDNFQTLLTEIGKLAVKPDYALDASGYDTELAAMNAGNNMLAGAKNESVTGSRETFTYNDDWTVVSETKTVDTKEGSLGSKVFGLSKATSSDTFGRTITTYTASKLDTSISLDTAAKLSTFGPVTPAELLAALGPEAEITTFVINKPGETATTPITSGGVWNATNLASNTATLGGYGVETSIYSTGKNAAKTKDTYKLVQVQYAVTQVANITHTNKGKATNGFDTYTFGDKVVTTSAPFVVITDKVVSTQTTNVKVEGTVSKNDWVLVYGAGVVNKTTNNPLVVAPVKTVTGTLTGSTATTYTIGGQSYNKSAILSNATGIVTGSYNKENTFALDSQGNVVGIVSETVPTNYVFVLGYSLANYLNGTRLDKVVEADAINTDGELVKIQIAKVKELDGTEDNFNTINAAANKGAFSYTPDAYGKYILTVPADNSVREIKETSLSATSSKLSDEVSEKLYANNSTVYYVAQKAADNVTYTGVSKYVGYAAMGNVNVSSLTKAAIDTNRDNIAEIVFLDSVSASNTAKYVYLTGNYSYDGNTFTYNTILDGTEDTMALSEVTSIALPALVSVNNNAAAELEAATLNVGAGTDGVYKAAPESRTYFTYKGGVLFSGTTETSQTTFVSEIGANVPVYTYENGTVTVSTAEGLSAANGDTVVLVLSGANGTIVKVLIDKGNV